MKRTKEFGVKITGVLMAGVIAASSIPSVDRNQDVSKVYAVEFTVTESKAVLYSNDKTKVYKQPDISSGVVTTIAKDIPVQEAPQEPPAQRPPDPPRLSPPVS